MGGWNNVSAVLLLVIFGGPSVVYVLFELIIWRNPGFTDDDSADGYSVWPWIFTYLIGLVGFGFAAAAIDVSEGWGLKLDEGIHPEMSTAAIAVLCYLNPAIYCLLHTVYRKVRHWFG